MSIYEPLFRALNASQTRFVVVGGVATVLHGYARFTADVDIIVDLDQEPLLAALEALTNLGLEPRLPVDVRDFADPRVRERWRAEKGMQVFSMHHPANPLLAVDLFVEHPVDFEALWARAEICDLDSFSVPIAAISDLIALKRIANRPRDLDDIAKLEAIRRARTNHAEEDD